MLNSDDYTRCTFGIEYFRGVKWGACFSFVVTMSLARRAHVKLLTKVKELGHKDVTPWTIDPWTMGFVCAMYTVSCAKVAKFVLSRARHNEFLFDEMLSDMAMKEREGSPEAVALTAMMEMRRKSTYSNTKRDAMPTFWDGFTVGVMGSVQDSYVPTKPAWMYTYLRAGFTS